HAGDFLIAHDDHVSFETEINSSAAFHVRAPLEQATDGFASFESVAYPGEYLRHQGFRLKLDAAAQDSDSLLRRDATFRLLAVE
ncbi:MAG: AbfB domain-containing protein, partial [Rhodobacteraceae bacterium]|nr:AbfB domain-containing protein [Paracoccaceae bacterium]